MADDMVVTSAAGVAFEDGDSRGRILVSSRSTGGAYSVMEWVVAASGAAETLDDLGAHQHGGIEEVFLVQSGELEFLLGDTITTIGRGDLVRVPPGVRHGYRNMTDAEVELIVTFIPGGFEELLVRYRTDQESSDGPGFVADATQDFETTFE